MSDIRLAGTAQASGAAAAPSEIIAVRDLAKRYATGREAVVALEGIDFAVAESEFVAIVGPSGCGKSTLLKILAGLLPTSAGAVLLRGVPIAGPRRDIGVVFQAPVLFPWRTVRDNVLLPIDVQRLGREKYQRFAGELLALVKRPHQLSGGMRQRVALARALAQDADVLLMDEPFGALDAMTREQMNVELQRIWLERRKTVLFITHSISEAVFLADRVLVMTPRPGRIMDDLRIELARPRSLDILNTPEFGAYARRIRACFSAPANTQADGQGSRLE